MTIRYRGFLLLVICAAVLIAMRIWIQVALRNGYMVNMPGVLFLLPQVIGAFGAAGALLGDRWRIARLATTLVLGIVFIALTYRYVVPRGSRLEYLNASYPRTAVQTRDRDLKRGRSLGVALTAQTQTTSARWLLPLTS